MIARTAFVLACAALLAGCGAGAGDAAVETLVPGHARLVVEASGELKSAKPTPLTVPGSNWASRRLDWMRDEGSVVAKGEVIARFSAEEGELQLAQALLDLERNALARAAKSGELDATQGRVTVDLAQVGTDLAIAERYAGADMAAIARNEVLDAIQDTRYLGEKRDTLTWRQGQAEVRGGAALAVLDAQRASIDLNAVRRREDLDALELVAPHDGVLVLAENWSGDKPSVGTTLRAGQAFGTLPDTSAMEVELVLPQLQALGVKAGNAVEVHPAGRPDQAIRTELSWVASAAKPVTRGSPVKYVAMKAPVPADTVRTHGWVPGQRLEARIVLLDARDALTVPNVAVRSEAGRHFVQVRDGSRFEQREVQLGVRGGARSQVLGGLAAGDVVRLAEAGAVQPTDDDAPPDDGDGDAAADGDAS